MADNSIPFGGEASLPDLALGTDDGHLSEQQLSEYAAYDDLVLSGRVELADVQPASDFARTVRLLHVTFGPLMDPCVDVNDGLEVDPEDREATDAAELPIPFGRFEILEMVGRGSFGCVWKAFDSLLRRDVAIKVPHAQIRLDPEVAKRFLREARAAARLNHPHIVRVLDAGIVEGIAYMATEFVAGETLTRLLKRQGPLEDRCAAQIVRQISDAVHHANQHGVLHRDIKPDNVLVEKIPALDANSPFVPRLTDFGLARITEDGAGESHNGLLIGTPNYMAPELASGQIAQHGPPSEVYSLGIFLFELLTGRCPYAGDNDLSTLMQVVGRRVESPRKHVPGISRDLESICLRCVERDPGDRYATAAELRDDLDRFLQGRSTLARPQPAYEQFLRWSDNHRTLTAVMITILAALVLLFGIVWNAHLAAETQNDLLIDAIDVAESARASALDSEKRFRELSWNTGIQRAYERFGAFDLLGTQLVLDQLRESQPEAIVRPEWRVLQTELQRRFRVLRQTPFPLHEVVAIPNSNLVAFAGQNQAVELFDSSNAKTVDRFETAIESVHALAVNSAGTTLAIGGSVGPDGQASPINIDLQTHITHEVNVSDSTTIESLSFSPDGCRLAAGFRYSGIQVATICGDAAGAVRQIAGDRRNHSVTWIGSTETLVSLQDLNTLQLTSGELDGQQRCFVSPEGYTVFAAIPERRQLAVVHYRDGNPEVISADDGQTVCELGGTTAQCGSISVSADGRWVAAGQIDGHLLIWSLVDPDKPEDDTSRDTVLAPVAIACVHEGSIASICWKDFSVITAGDDGRVIECHLVDALGADPGSGDAITAAAFTADSRTVLLGDRHGRLCSASAEALLTESRETAAAANETRDCVEFERTLAGSMITAIATSGDGSQIAIGDATGRLTIVDAKRLSAVSTYAPPMLPDDVNKAVTMIAFSKDSETVFWTGVGLVVYRAGRGDADAAALVDLPSVGHAIAVSPADETLAVGGQFEGIRFFSPADGSKQSADIGNSSMSALTYANDGRSLIAGRVDGTILSRPLVSTASDTLLRAHRERIASVSLTGHSGTGFSVDAVSSVAVWNAATGNVFGTLSPPTPAEWCHTSTRPLVLVSPNGDWLLTLRKQTPVASEIRLYDLRSGSSSASSDVVER